MSTVDNCSSAGRTGKNLKGVERQLIRIGTEEGEEGREGLLRKFAPFQKITLTLVFACPPSNHSLAPHTYTPTPTYTLLKKGRPHIKRALSPTFSHFLAKSVPEILSIMIPPHHVVTLSTGSTTPTTTDYASSSTSSRASSPRSSSQIDHSIIEDDGPSPRLSEELAYSDSYDSSQEGANSVVSRRGGGGGGGSNHLLGQLQTPLTTTNHNSSSISTSTSLLNLGVSSSSVNGGWSGDEGNTTLRDSYYSTSRVSSRAASPIPGGLGLTGTTASDGLDGYLSYRASGGLRTAGARSRNVSGFSTPTTPAEEKESYDTDCTPSFSLLSLSFYSPITDLTKCCVLDYDHQTSALLHKLSGSGSGGGGGVFQQQTPDTSPTLVRNKKSEQQRKPGWWSRRAAESRRKPTLSSSSFSSTAPLLPHSRSSSKHHHYRDTSSTSSITSSSSSSSNPLLRLVHTILRQPYVPTQPLTILFSILLFLCFAATLTTFLLNVLSSDREPLPWRQFCQEQRTFPHSLADSLKPVNVFVGVFSVDAAVDRRNAIRLSYAKHSLPIDPLTNQPGQNIQLKFVLGRPREKWSKRVSLEMEMFNDIIVLDVSENMNKGKTFEFFKWANENATVPVYYTNKEGSNGEEGGGKREVGVGFRKVDYVVKADDDAFIVLSELERHLRLTPRENTYWGCKFPLPLSLSFFSFRSMGKLMRISIEWEIRFDQESIYGRRSLRTLFRFGQLPRNVSSTFKLVNRERRSKSREMDEEPSQRIFDSLDHGTMLHL